MTNEQRVDARIGAIFGVVPNEFFAADSSDYT